MGSAARARPSSTRFWRPRGRLPAGAVRMSEMLRKSMTSSARRRCSISSRRAEPQNTPHLSTPLFISMLRPRRMLSRTDIPAKRATFWNVRAIPCRATSKARRPVMSVPLSSTLPVVGGIDPAHHVDEGGLARSVGADDGVDLLRLRGQGRLAQGEHPPERLRRVDDFKTIAHPFRPAARGKGARFEASGGGTFYRASDGGSNIEGRPGPVGASAIRVGPPPGCPHGVDGAPGTRPRRPGRAGGACRAMRRGRASMIRPARPAGRTVSGTEPPDYNRPPSTERLFHRGVHHAVRRRRARAPGNVSEPRRRAVRPHLLFPDRPPLRVRGVR